MQLRRSRLAAASLVLASMVAGVVPGTAGPAHAEETTPFAGEQELVNRVNQARQTYRLPPLTFHPALSWVSRDWTDALASQRQLAHNGGFLYGSWPGWSARGEVVGQTRSIAEAVEMWMASPPHRASLLGNFTHLGIGVARGGDGLLYTTVDLVAGGPCPASSNPAPKPSTSAATGYYVLGHDGGIFTHGSATFRGSVPGLGVRTEVVLMAVTPSQQGYWVLGGDGGVFSFGDARYHGSLPGLGVRGRAVDLKPTPTGNGYWMLGADGGVFSFGDARFHGSVPGLGVSDPAIKLVPTPTGNGYWVLGGDGGVFSFGDARFHGSVPGTGASTQSISMASTPTGGGYWVLGADGGVFSFGDARFRGSVPGVGQCVAAQGVQLVGTRTGGGYYVLSTRGEVFAFGDAPYYGSPASFRVRGRDLAVVSR